MAKKEKQVKIPKYMVFETAPFMSFIGQVKKVRRNNDGRIYEVDLEKIGSITLELEQDGRMKVGFRNLSITPIQLMDNEAVTTVRMDMVLSYTFDPPENVIDNYTKMISSIIIPNMETSETPQNLLLENDESKPPLLLR